MPDKVGELKKQGADVLFIRVDVSNAAQIDKLIEQTVEMFGRLDILVNNAGINH